MASVTLRNLGGSVVMAVPKKILNLVQLDLIGVKLAVLHMDPDIASCDREFFPFAALQLIRFDRDNRFQLIDPIEQIPGPGTLG